MKKTIVFGDSAAFSIQVILQSNGSRLDQKFGNICMFCNDEMIGDTETTVILSAVAIQLQQRLKAHDKDLAMQLFPMESHALIDHVTNALNASQNYADAKPYESLCLAPGTSEAFDGDIIIWLTNEKFDRVVWRKFGSTDIKQLFIPFGIVVQALQGFIKFVEAGC